MLAELFLQTALAFLSREVPRWSQENHCYSCHNNGDAARALYVARVRGYEVPAAALADTTAWLRTPEKWGEIHGAPAASDKKLARIQFAAALAEAYRTGAITSARELRSAARVLASMQDIDGSWRVDTGGLARRSCDLRHGVSDLRFPANAGDGRRLQPRGSARHRVAGGGETGKHN